MIRPHHRLLVKTHRRMSLVEPELVKLFRQLVSGRVSWPLYLHGATGTGKSLGALSLCDFARTATFWTVDGLCDFTMGNEPAAVSAMWEEIAEKDLAVLDELGTRQQVGDLHYSVVKRFADERELHADRAAIYISNLSPEDFQKIYDDRISSRALCGTTFELKGNDRRWHF